MPTPTEVASDPSNYAPPTPGERLRDAMVDIDMTFDGRQVRTDEEIRQLEQEVTEQVREHFPGTSGHDQTCTDLLVSAFMEAVKRRSGIDLDQPRHYGMDAIKQRPEGIKLIRPIGDFQNLILKYVAWADPPVPTSGGVNYLCEGGLVTHPHFWASNASEKLLEIECDWVTVLASTWHPHGGPIYVGEVKLRQILYLNRYLTILGLCASIEYFPKQVGEYTVCNDNVVVGLGPSRYGGCNPANFGFFPYAPTYQRRTYGQMIGQRRQRSEDGDAVTARRLKAFLTRPRITTALAVRLFPDINFETNLLLEYLAKTGRTPR